MADLRQWLGRVAELGELQTLRGVPWDLEMGAITEMVGRQGEKPAVLFDEIPGYPPGYRVLINPLGSRNRFALAMGLPLGLTEREMVQEWRRRLRGMELLPPRFVAGGPLMENTLRGEEVDLLRFPAPKWHELDGGRYIGSGDVVITREPDGGWLNLGTYRAMIHDRNHVGLQISPTHHGQMHLQQWWAQGEAMPIALATGIDPLLFVVGATELAPGVNEYDYAGGLRGEPIEVVRGSLTGLPIPAAAELVLEGFVRPHDLRPEGPFGEYTGYYGSHVRPEPVMTVEAVYYRHDPIILGTPPLKPIDYTSLYYMETMRAALLWDALEAAGIPDVTGVWFNVTRNFFITVAIKQRYPGHAKQAGRIATQCSVANLCGRFTVVVDEDIDVADIGEVLWAMCTRVDPDRDIEILRERSSHPLDPIVPPERKPYATTSTVVIDATRPYEWRERFPEVVASSPELRQQVLARWGEALKGIV